MLEIASRIMREARRLEMPLVVDAVCIRVLRIVGINLSVYSQETVGSRLALNSCSALYSRQPLRR